MLDRLELELQKVVNHHVGTGTKPGFSMRTCLSLLDMLGRRMEGTTRQEHQEQHQRGRASPITGI